MSIEFSKEAHSARNADSRRRPLRPSGPRRQPRLVQGKLAAGEDGGPRAARLPPRAEQHLVQRKGRHHPRDPRRAVGQVHLRGHRAGSSAPGWTCAKGPSFGAVFTAELDPSQAIFIPRGVGNAFQTLEDNTAYTYLVNDHWSADAQGQYTFLNLADETAGDRLADSAGRRPSFRTRTRPTRAWRTSCRCRPRRSSWSARTDSWARPCGKLYDGDASVEFAGRARLRPRQRGRPSPPGTGRTTPPSSTPPRTPPWTPPKPPRAAQPPGPSTSTAVARLARTAVEHDLTLVHVSSRLRLRRHPQEHTRGRTVHSAGRVRPDQSSRRRRRQRCSPALHRADQLGHRRGQQLRPHHGLARGPRQSSPSVVDDQIGRLSFTDGHRRGHPAPARDPARPTARTT